MNFPTIVIPGHTHYITLVSQNHMTVSSLTIDLLYVFYSFLYSYGKLETLDEQLGVINFYPKTYYVDSLGQMWFEFFQDAINEVAIAYYDEKGIDIRQQVEDSNND